MKGFFIMKRFLLTALATSALVFAGASAFAAEQFALDPAHTNVVWKADHLGFSYPSGKFAQVEGTLILDEKKPEKSSVRVTLYPESIVTGNDKFNGHLSSADFFNVEKFTKAEFVSKSVEQTGDKTADIHGELTLLGVTKPLVLKAKLNKVGPNPFSQTKTAGFSATGVIKRSEFGMGWGLPNIGDDVQIDIEAEFVKN